VGKRLNSSKSSKHAAVPEPVRTPTVRRFARVWRPALLVIVSFLVYSDSLNGGFVWDDNLQIQRNAGIRSLDNIPKYFTASLWAFSNTSGKSTDRYYRPIQNVIFTLTYYFGQLSPFAFHLVSVSIHAAATLAVFFLCLELGLRNSTSLTAAAIFAVHPVHTEAVAWISGVGEVACGLFYFSALWAFVRYLNRKTWVWLGLSAILFMFALLSKEMAVTFPIAVVLILLMKQTELRFSIRKLCLTVAPSFFVLGLYLAVRVYVVGSGLAFFLEQHANGLDWISLGVWMFGRYLRYALLPYPLAIFHPVPLYFSARVFSTGLYSLLIASVVFLLWHSRRIIPHGLLWLTMFAAMLAPVFYFKGISGGSIFAERYLYIPTLPIAVLAAILLSKWMSRLAVIAPLILIAVFSTATIARNLDWRNDERLNSTNLDVYPTNANASLNLAALYLDTGKYQQAEQCLEIAKNHIAEQNFSPPHALEYRLEVGLGTLAAKRSQSSEAHLHLNKAIALYPDVGDAYTILAAVLMNIDKDFQGALPVIEKAMELGSTDDQARDSMGVALYNLKRYEEAEQYFRHALEINPESDRARQHLDVVLKRLGN